MFQNYFKIAVRNLLKHKSYSLINITGLSIGMACCMLMVLYIQDEISYDRFNEKADRVYRVVAGNGGDGQPTNANGAFSWAPALRTDFGREIERAVRFRKMGWNEKRVIAHGDNRFYEPNLFFADQDVFNVFTFPFIQGDPHTALIRPNTIVITESMSQKYFGNQSALGKTLAIDAYNDGQFPGYEVTGVIKNLPSNSHIQFDFLASFASLKGRTEGWGFDPVFTYVLLAPGVSKTEVESQFDGFLKKHMKEPWYAISLQPLTEIRLHSKLRAELTPNGDMQYVYIFSAIAVFILAIACINFMNLATARSSQRAREVGMRKVLGAYRSQLIRQFLSEALMLSFLSTVISFGLIELFLPVFNAIAGKRMTIDFLSNFPMLGGLIVTGLIGGLAAGSYPAFFLSAFQPIEVLKGKLKSGSTWTTWFRKGLVIFQFAISVILIIGTLVVSDQMQLIRRFNLGFDRGQIVILPVNNGIRQNIDAFRTAMLSNAGVQNLTLTEQVPARSGNGNGYRVEGVSEELGLHRYFVDYYFLQTYGIPLVAGRNFDDSRPSDATSAFLVNEAFLREAGWSSPEIALGKSIKTRWSGQDISGNIIGVAKDFQLFSFRETVTPLAINMMPLKNLNFISLRIAAHEYAPVLNHVESVWKQFSPDYPFDYYFLDDDFDRLHRADEQLGRVFAYFAFLAIFIACLGLFGLAAFTTEQRTKEIGIRKVLGANMSGIVTLLSKDFVKLVLIAGALACPAAYFIMQQWQADFVYKAPLSVGTFLIATTLALVIAIATVSYQAVKAATSDPVKTLKYE
ncbi:ABC transporter permease [bacterium]|nr:ABC transporter permease [bacterium]